MWTLVLFAMVANTSASGGGAHSSVTTLQFDSQQKCNAAASLLTDQGNYMGRPPVFYRIFGKCIQN
jgi:hypothetical protein